VICLGFVIWDFLPPVPFLVSSFSPSSSFFMVEKISRDYICVMEMKNFGVTQAIKKLTEKL
jgi:hypothetical protein